MENTVNYPIKKLWDEEFHNYLGLRYRVNDDGSEEIYGNAGTLIVNIYKYIITIPKKLKDVQIIFELTAGLRFRLENPSA